MAIERLTTSRKAMNLFSQRGRNINNLVKYDCVRPLGANPISADAYMKELKDGKTMLKIYNKGSKNAIADRTFIVHEDGSFEYVIPKEKAFKDNGRTTSENRLMYFGANGGQGISMFDNANFPPFTFMDEMRTRAVDLVENTSSFLNKIGL